MNMLYLARISGMCFLVGITLALVQKEYIIIRLPSYAYTTSSPFLSSPTENTDSIPQKDITRKELCYYFWHRDQWHEERHISLWSPKKDANLKHIITTWFAIAHQEGILPVKINVQTVALNHNGYTAFVSLDQNPIPHNESIYIKLQFIHGLLKTIRHTDITLQSVYFLHNHTPLHDAHIDFSQPWPIDGFLPG